MAPKTRIDVDIQGEQSNENFETVFTRWRNAMRDNHHRCPRRDEMRHIEQPRDVYVKFFTTIRISYRLGSYVYNKREKHTDKRYSNMQ